ncbi:MAG: LPXTG cell wall anchor domain-containing protein [Ruminococcaceae bacterium]|nr:LPXTG cell wall anchor domain-containing protein [Oscillospiraceae bacterium]
MKIAKKVLAVAMAVAMIACFAAMAFAAEDKVVLKAGEVVDGKFNLEVIGTDYADLKAADWVVTYDAAALKCTAAAAGTGDFTKIATDPVLMAQASSLLITAFNTDVAGEVKAGFAFTNELGTAAETVIFTLTFEVVDADAKNVEIKLTGSDEAVLVFNEEAEEPSTEEPTTEEPTTEEPTTEEPTTDEAPSTPVEDEKTTAAGADDGDNKTGDTGVLALAAGVVALAGAAFVVSKKRR